EGVLAEIRALRTAQDLDTLDVDEARVDLLTCRRHGNLIQILAHGSGGRLRRKLREVTDAAQGEIEWTTAPAKGIHHQAGDGAEIVLEGLRVEVFQLDITDRGHRFGQLLHT